MWIRPLMSYFVTWSPCKNSSLFFALHTFSEIINGFLTDSFLSIDFSRYWLIIIMYSFCFKNEITKGQGGNDSRVTSRLPVSSTTTNGPCGNQQVEVDDLNVNLELGPITFTGPWKFINAQQLEFGIHPFFMKNGWKTDDFQVFFVFEGWNLCSCFATKCLFLHRHQHSLVDECSSLLLRILLGGVVLEGETKRTNAWNGKEDVGLKQKWYAKVTTSFVICRKTRC